VKEVRLETDRLILRTYRLTDFEDHFKLCADPDVMRYLIGGKPLTKFEAWRHMAFLVGHWELLGYGYFVAEEKASSRFVGRIGFTNPEGWPGFEIGWTIAPEFQGRGVRDRRWAVSAAVRVRRDGEGPRDQRDQSGEQAVDQGCGAAR